MKKKLIEVALPLEAINVASAREKSIRHGHPSTLHLWWARRPLAAARAVIFAQMVDDPSGHPDRFPTEEAQEVERQRLFRLIERLVLWENTTNEDLLRQARDEIRKSWRATCAENADHPRAAELFAPDRLPAFHDPFAGGGALPLEAQRLGLESYASDLNPVAVLINKAMIEIPPKFAGRPPVHPDWQGKSPQEKEITRWQGAQGLADDVRYYGQWMRDEAERRIGHLYPKIEITQEMVAGSAGVSPARPDLQKYVGRKLTVIAWLWARTVKSPNPAFAHIDVPLASTFMLSTKKGKEAYVEPVVLGARASRPLNQNAGETPAFPGDAGGTPAVPGYYFTVKVGKPEDPEAAKNGTKLARGANFRCLMSGTPIASEHIYAEANAGRMGARLMAIVAEGDRGRVYLPPTEEMETIARQAKPEWKPEVAMPENPRWFSPPLYGLKTYGDLFTPRQLVALTTFSDLVQEARKRIEADCLRPRASRPSAQDEIPLNEGGIGARAYAEAVGVYLGFLVDQQTNQSSTICGWNNINQQMIVTFSRQAIPMVWDFAECNVLSKSTGSLWNLLERQVKGIASLSMGDAEGRAFQDDARVQDLSSGRVVSTDPPYYDNIGYADLSDFFYVWLRRSLKSIYPDLFATLAVPKAEELIATPYRHGSKGKAETFFLDGMTQAMHRLAEQAHPAFPVTIYYAFKQSESKGGESTASTGWETFLDAVIRAGFALTGTWPVRTESANKLKSKVNALASCIVLVCRQRAAAAPVATRREFATALKAELPTALALLQKGNVAPVDLAQSAIGPGMAIFTRYKQVIGADGSPMSVRAALQLINEALDAFFSQQEGDYDEDTRFALTWFDQRGMEPGPYGEAENLATARNIAVAGVVEAGILEAKGGIVRLLRREEMDNAWNPTRDARLTVWEMTQHLIRALETGGESAAGRLLARIETAGATPEPARELAYRLYTACERKGWAEEARSYNGLVIAWPDLNQAAAEATQRATEPSMEQEDLLQ